MRVAARGIYIATCQPYDQEMSERITIHQRDRTDTGYSWETLEDPYDAADQLHQIDKELSQDAAVADGKKPVVVLLECLTLWLTNWLMRIEHEALEASRLEIEISKLLDGIQSFSHPLLARLPFGAAEAEINRGIAAVETAASGGTGVHPATPFFRFPGFASSPALLDRLRQRGIVVFGADLWASDWNPRAGLEGRPL